MANLALTSCLLFTVIHQILTLMVDIPQPVYEVACGDNAKIPCKFVPAIPNPTRVVITWAAKSTTDPDEETDIVTYYHLANFADQIDISADYTNRVVFEQDISKGQTSLTLSSVTSKDNTTLLCKVQILGDETGKPFDTAKLVVLKKLAPSQNSGRPIAEGIPCESTSKPPASQTTATSVQGNGGVSSLTKPSATEEEETLFAAFGKEFTKALLEQPVKELYKIHLTKEIAKSDLQMEHIKLQLSKTKLEIELLEHKLKEKKEIKK